MATYRRATLKASRLLVVIAFSSIVSACVSSTQSGPRRLFSIEEEEQSIKAQIRLPDFAYYAQLLPAARKDYRNDYISTRMYAMDLEYSEYESALTRERQKVGFITDVAVLGVTLASPLAGAVATKDILAAAASGLTGTRAAYNDDILLNQTVQILQMQMRASRALVSAQILERMRLDEVGYPLATALSDLEEYYRAGTLNGALVHVGESVGEGARIRRNVRDLTIAAGSARARARYRDETRLRPVPLPALPGGAPVVITEPPAPATTVIYPPTIVDEAGRRIYDYLRGPNGKPDPGKRIKLEAILAANQITLDVAPNLLDPSQATNRLIIARAAGLLP